MGAHRVKILYFSLDYTTHDRRFLDSLCDAGCDVYYLRVHEAKNTYEQRSLPGSVRPVAWKSPLQPYGTALGWCQRLYLVWRALKEICPDVVIAGPVQDSAFMVASTGYSPLIAMSWGSDLLVRADRNVWTRAITRFTLRRSAAIFGDCQAVRNKVHDLVAYPGEKILAFPWGINLVEFQPGRSRLNLRMQLGWENCKVLISTRSWEPGYAIDVLVKAFAILYRRCPEARLLLLGDGSEQTAIRSLIAELGLKRAVYTPGRIPYELLPEYFRLANVYVSSALSDGTSISLLEAMACGLAVVVSDGYGNIEWVEQEKNGWLVPPGNPLALAEALCDALVDSERLRKFGEVNIALVKERADWKRNFPLLMTLVDDVIATRLK